MVFFQDFKTGAAHIWTDRIPSADDQYSIRHFVEKVSVLNYTELLNEW